MTIRQTMADKSDEELVGLYIEGQEWAFRELLERYSKKILNYINRIIYDRDRAEDLLQDTFIRVHRNIDRFNTERRFSTWLYSIATNLAKNELRNVGRSPVFFFQTLIFHNKYKQMFEAADRTPKPDDLLYKSQLKQIVAKAVRELPEQHRLIFTLREIEGKSYREIAEITDSNIGTVKSRLNRSRRCFASIIEPYLN